MTLQPNQPPVPDLDWYRDIVDGAPETIIIINRDCIILFHNSAAEGYDPAQFVGQSLFQYFLPEFQQLVRGKIEGVFKSGQVDSYQLASTYTTTAMRWYMTILGPVIRSGEVVAVTLFIRNITELKTAQQALSHVNEDLERRVEERTHALNQLAYRLQASEKLNAVLRQAENRQQVIEILARQSLSALQADLAGVYQFKENQLTHSISLGHSELPPDTLSPQYDQFLYRLLHSNKIRYVPLNGEGEDDERDDCHFCSYIHSQHMRALLVAPLRTGESVVGVLYLGFRAPHERVSDDEQLLNTFVESGSNTLHRIQVMEQLEQNVQRRENELRVLYEIMSIASDEQDTERLLKKSLASTLRAVGCDTGLIHLAEPGDPKLKLAAQQGFADALHDFLQLSGLSSELWRKVYTEKQMVQVRRLQSQSYYENTGPGVVVLTYLGVPVRSKDVTVGVLSIFGEDPALLDPAICQLVSTIADQIGLALESTHQRQRDKEALILEERQRLARELHDSVSQSLYGLVLSADISKKLLKLKAYPKLADKLYEIGDVALQSLKEMRLMLFELRPLSLETVGLVGALDLRLNTVERRASIETAFEVTGKDHLPRSLDLDIYRIASEALNNSLKHARASVVRVALNASPEAVELLITDDGKGFEHDRKRKGGIGLSSMKERSTRIGGTLTIDSVTDSGTHVHLLVPLRPAGTGALSGDSSPSHVLERSSDTALTRFSGQTSSTGQTSGGDLPSGASQSGNAYPGGDNQAAGEINATGDTNLADGL